MGFLTMTRRWTWPFVLAALLSSAAAAAQPAPRPDATADGREKELARDWAKKGRERFDQGHYAGAIEALREAEKHFPAATIVRLRGDAHVKLGQLLEARKAYQQVADEVLAPDASSQLRAAQESAKAALADLERRIPTIDILMPPSARTGTVKLDGRVVPAADLSRSIAVDPGKHIVLLEVPGAEPRIREVQLEEGARERVRLGTTSSPPVDSTAGGAEGAGRSWVGPGILFGVAGAGLVAGAVTGLLTVTKMDEVRATCGEALRCPDDYRGEIDAARTIGHVSTASFIVAGAGAAAGVVLLLLPQKSAGVTTSLSVGPGSVTLRGAW